MDSATSLNELRSPAHRPVSVLPHALQALCRSFFFGTFTPLVTIHPTSHSNSVSRMKEEHVRRGCPQKVDSLRSTHETDAVCFWGKYPPSSAEQSFTNTKNEIIKIVLLFFPAGKRSFFLPFIFLILLPPSPLPISTIITRMLPL